MEFDIQAQTDINFLCSVHLFLEMLYMKVANDIF